MVKTSRPHKIKIWRDGNKIIEEHLLLYWEKMFFFFNKFRKEVILLNEDKLVYKINMQKILEDNNISLPPNNQNIIQKDNRPYYVSVPLSNQY